MWMFPPRPTEASGRRRLPETLVSKGVGPELSGSRLVPHPHKLHVENRYPLWSPHFLPLILRLPFL